MTPSTNQIKKPRSIMIYSDSRVGKTTNLYFLVKYLWEKYNKISRVIIGDPGGATPFIDSGMVDNGIVELFDFSYRQLAIADFRRLAKGYWPTYSSKGVEYFRSDSYCETTKEKWETIGGYFIDSMSSVGRLLISHCSDQQGGLGFKEAWSYEEDGETIRGLQQGHYGIVQKEIYKLHAHGFSLLPVQMLGWTALVGKGEDKRDRSSKYGPQLVGNASTPEIPTWFNDTFHFEKIIESKEDPNNKGVMIDVEKRVAWFIEHPDRETGISYLCGPRMMPEIYQGYLNTFKSGYIQLGLAKGIEKHYEALEILNRQFRENNKKGKGE